MQIFEVEVGERTLYFINYDAEKLKKEFLSLADRIREVKKINGISDGVVIAINHHSTPNILNISQKIAELVNGIESKIIYVDLYHDYLNKITHERIFVDKEITRMYSTQSIKIDSSVGEHTKFFSYLIIEILKKDNLVIRSKNNKILSLYRKNKNLINITQSLIGQDNFVRFSIKNIKNKSYLQYLTTISIISIFIIRLSIDKSVFSWDPASLAEYTFMMSRSFATMDIESFSQTLQIISPNRTPLLVLLAWPLVSLTYGFSELIAVMLFNLLVLLCILVILTNLVNSFYPIKNKANKYSFTLLTVILLNSAFVLYISTEFWTEPIQTLTILCGLGLIAIHIQNRITTNLFIFCYTVVLFFVLLAKLTLVIFPIVNLIIYFVLLKLSMEKQVIKTVKISYGLSLKLVIFYIITVAIVLQGLYWMFFNLNSVLRFSIDAAFGNISSVYGINLGYSNKLIEWITLLINYFSNRFTFFYFLILLIIFLIKVSTSYLRKITLSTKDIYVIFLIISCFTGLLIISFQNGFNFRFLSPILANYVLITYFLIRGLTKKFESIYLKLIVILPVLYFSLANVLNWMGLAVLPLTSMPIIKIEQSTNDQLNINKVIDITCKNQIINTNTLIVFDIEELNYNNLNFYANISMYPKIICRYNYLGFNIQDWNYIQSRIETAEEKFLVSYNLQAQDPPLEPVFNNYYVLEINNYLEGNPNFELIETIDSKFNVYRRIE